MNNSVKSPQKPKPNAFSRRVLMQAGVLGLSSLELSRRAFGQTFSPPTEIEGEREPSGIGTRAVVSQYPLVDRMTFGTTYDEVTLYNSKGWAAYLEYHLAPEKISDNALTNRLQEFPCTACTPYQNLRVYGWRTGYDVYYDMASAQIVRAAYAKAQLLEVMTEFWLDHFNVFNNAISNELLPTYVRTIRSLALSDFPTLLRAVVKSGAMMQYLDNDRNITGQHNENFARELMELHTLGVYNGYSETDIYVARRCFTGWSREAIDDNMDTTTNKNWGLFKFYPDCHDNEGGYFLGTKSTDLIVKGGIEQGEGILTKLALNPNTANTIATKLCQRFLGENVSATFIQSTANTFLTSNGDIKTVLRYILNETNFKANYSPRFKRPFRYLISSIRASYGNIVDTGDVLWWLLQPLRQQPFQWGPPNGYPDTYLAWVDNLLPRWKAGMGIAQNNFWGVRTNPFLYMTGRTPANVVTYINKYLFGGGLSASSQASLQAYMKTNTPTNAQIRETIGLALSSPDFMMY